MFLKWIRLTLFLMSGVIAAFSLNSCSSSPSEPGLVAGANTGANTGAGTNTGGIGGSGCAELGCVDLAVGDITGFSSVIINGAVYDTTEAQFSINGMPATRDDFRVGMNVTAAVNVDQPTFLAGSISYAPIVLGPVTTTDLTSRSFEILGQTVVVDTNTALDGVSLDANASDVIAAGAVIEVSGLRNVDNNIVATYIRRADSATSYQLQGSIDAETNAAQQLLIDGLLVDVSGLDPSQLSANANIGNVISLFLTPDTQTITAVPGSLVAPVLTINQLLERFNGSQIRAEGFIVNNSLSLDLGLGLDLNLTFTFTFGDLQVFVTEGTEFRFADGSRATSNDLGANSRIELIATTTGVGIVTADEVVIIEP